MIWEEFPWAFWNGMLVGGPKFRETDGLKAGEGVLRGTLCKVGCSMFLNPRFSLWSSVAPHSPAQG